MKTRTSAKAKLGKPQPKTMKKTPLSKKHISMKSTPRSQSQTMVSQMKDAGKNFYAAGKEVVSEGKQLINKISVKAEDGLVKVVEIAVKAEEDAAYGRKVTMILGMILTTLMFLFARLGENYGYKDMNVAVPIGYKYSGEHTPVSPKYVEELKAHIQLLITTKEQYNSLPFGSEKSAFLYQKLNKDKIVTIDELNDKLASLQRELVELTTSKTNLQTANHSIWSVAASALALTLLGRAAFMNKKEQFYYFVDFIIAFLVCSVVYFITVYLSRKFSGVKDIESKKAIFSSKDFIKGTDDSLGAIQTTAGTIGSFFSNDVKKWIMGFFGTINTEKSIPSTNQPISVFGKDDKIPDDNYVYVDGNSERSIETEIVDLDLDKQVGKGLEGKKNRTKRRKMRGGLSVMSTEISLPTVLAVLSGLFSSGYLASPKRRDAFFKRLNEILGNIKSYISQRKIASNSSSEL